MTETRNNSPNAVSLTAMPVADLEKLLLRVGSRQASAAVIESDLQAGAPVNPDGTMNLVAYAAWLVKEMAHAH